MLCTERREWRVGTPQISCQYLARKMIFQPNILHSKLLEILLLLLEFSLMLMVLIPW